MEVHSPTGIQDISTSGHSISHSSSREAGVRDSMVCHGTSGDPKEAILGRCFLPEDP